MRHMPGRSGRTIPNRLLPVEREVELDGLQDVHDQNYLALFPGVA